MLVKSCPDQAVQFDAVGRFDGVGLANASDVEHVLVVRHGGESVGNTWRSACRCGDQ